MIRFTQHTVCLLILSVIILTGLTLLPRTFGQNTAPVPTTFEILSSETLYANETGEPIENASVLALPDTLDPFKFTGTISDTSYPGQMTVSWSFTWRRSSFKGHTTGLKNVQWILPGPTTENHPESLFAVVWNPAECIPGNRFRFELKPYEIGSPYVLNLNFKSDSVQGTAQDTSQMIYVGRGSESVTLGLYKYASATSADYIIIYSSGLTPNFGPADPVDTLADSSAVRLAASDRWTYWQYTNLVDASLLRVVRTGKAEADTGMIQESLRVRPR